jgi:hypothetical protein
MSILKKDITFCHHAKGYSSGFSPAAVRQSDQFVCSIQVSGFSVQVSALPCQF